MLRVLTNTSVVRWPAHVPGDQVQDLRHLLGGGHRAELVVGQLQGQVQLPAVAGIHDRAPRRPVRVVAVLARADQQPGDRSRSAAGWRTGPPAAPAPSATCASRSRVRARCEPRLFPATAWISSTMTVRALRSIDRLRSAVTSRYSDSGVVIRMSGGCLSMAARSAAAVSPVLTATRIAGAAQPELPGHRGDLAQRRLEVLLDVGRQRLQRRHVHHLRPGACPGGPAGPAPGLPRARSKRSWSQAIVAR